ncbi:TPA: putative phage abortive infection protein [Enterobacter asburiae]
MSVLNTLAQQNQYAVQFFVALGTVMSVVVALMLSFINRRAERFDSNFSLLLSQHNEQLNALRNHPDFADKFSYVLAGGGQQAERSLYAANMRMHEKDMFFSSYFRVLYHLLKLIDKNYSFDFRYKKRKFHTSIIRSFISFEVLILLVVNVAHSEKAPSYSYYRTLLERYAFLEHLPVEDWRLLDGLPDVYTNEIAFNTLFSDEGRNLELITDIILLYKEKAFGNHDSLTFIKNIRAKAKLDID